MVRSTIQSLKKNLPSSWVLTSLKTRYYSSMSISSEVPKERVECVVIGAGVVGLSVARELALGGREVLVLDSAPTFGTATSSRNSEVIHAGIYYPPNSLKVFFFFVFFFSRYFLETEMRNTQFCRQSFV